MIQTLQEVFQRALERLSTQVVTYIPPLLVGLTILGIAFVLAHLVRLLISRVFKGAGMDRLLRESGVAAFLPGSGRTQVAPLVAASMYWLILLLGVLTAVNVFDTKLTSQIVEGTVYLFPKLVAAGAILLAGFWLAQFLGRSILVWVCNEGIPCPRRVAAAVRVAIVFMAIVVAADMLDFAERVFFAAFVIVAGGTVLTLSLALGLGAREAVGRWLRENNEPSREEKSLLNHV